MTIGSIGLNIKSNDYKFYLIYSPLPRVSLSGELVLGDYSDGNTKQSLLLEAGYQVKSIPYFRIAYNYFYLDYKYPAGLFTEGNSSESAYWDPIDFKSHSLRLEFHDNYRKHLLYGSETTISFIPKSEGLSYSIFIFASHNFTKQLALRLDGRWFKQDRGVDRIGETGLFWADNYNMSFQYRF